MGSRARAAAGRAARLFGLRDGTANPDAEDDALMRRLVWTPEGGTYMAVRLARMHLEFWDRVELRRSWSYQRGFDRAGQLDQGLIFVAYNQTRSGSSRPCRSALPASR